GFYVGMEGNGHTPGENSMRRTPALWLTAAGLLLSAAQAPAQAPAALTWKELLDCELVVKAHYQSHQGSALSLEIVEVLRGKAGKPGEVLKIKLSGAGAVKLS